ncbi:hypothetical protein E3N88_01294 [Mikania micrantha]|uniref:Uncharacterized protein n=1 Tax=Mikania micrantha TaxID=192012 RepID=A0A5N6Q2U7_9ASTR|nr:hypothetical protein E3N88_01294 [Mikania micrantha]
MFGASTRIYYTSKSPKNRRRKVLKFTVGAPYFAAKFSNFVLLAMSTGVGRKVTPEDIEMVKDLIERCLVNYMKRKEVVEFLYQQQNIEPCFTKIVWKRLEEQNKNFFRNYYLRLALKDQITRFNNLLEKQAEIMKQMNMNETAAVTPMQPIAVDLPASGSSNPGSFGLQNSSDDPLFNNVPLTQILNAEQSMIDEIIPVNNDNGDLGNSRSISSSSNMDLCSQDQSVTTFAADLAALMAYFPEIFFDYPDAKTVENQSTSFG